MTPEFQGLEDRLDELNTRLTRLQELAQHEREEFDTTRDLRDIAERNFEVAAQCCIDIAHRIISLEEARKPQDYYESFLRLGELDVISDDLARTLAPLAGFRNALVHEYAKVDWDEVYGNFDRLSDLEDFKRAVGQYMRERGGE
ncbi:MAG: type VII toxin-antitoxin system HepT family RNase toxin [Candidatus Brocadiia bacterium]